MANITQQQLDDFKKLFPGDQNLQNLSLPAVLHYAEMRPVDWHGLKFGHPRTLAATTATTLTECQKAIGWVIVDCICLGVGAYTLRPTVPASAAENMVRAAAPALSKIEKIVAEISAADSLPKQAWGVFKILKEIWNADCLSAVFAAFVDSLSWWDAILYGITGLATIVAALATEGIAFVGEVVILLATAGFLASDSVKAYNACSAQPPPEPFVSGAIRTINGHTLTIVNNGGLGTDDVAIRTDKKTVGDYEKFTLVPIDVTRKMFALKTANGRYVTAVRGGGIGGPNDATSPVHTDATWTGPWEALRFERQANGTYAICTTSGNYLTAVRGGGWGEGANTKPIHTDATALGPWETFTLAPIVSTK